MYKFSIIGIDDNPLSVERNLHFARDVLGRAKVFSGGKRHYELVKDYLPCRYTWIDITVPLDDVFAKYLAEKYPESFDKAVPAELVYSGSYKLTDPVEGAPINAGKLVLSPTRTYAPVVKRLLDELRPEIHGMVHCTGGAQTKVLHFRCLR